MEGQTATNPQTGEKVIFRGGQWQPLGGSAPAPRGGPISSGVKPEDPYKASAEQRARRDQQMQEERDRVAREKDAVTIERDSLKLQRERAANAATGGVDASVEQGKAATFALRAQRANAAIEAEKLDPDSMIGKIGYSIAPDITSMVSSDKRNAQRSRESDFIASVLRYESGAAIPPTEFDTAYKIYFPSPDAGPKEIEAKRQARANAIEGLRLGAGPNVARIGEVNKPEMVGGVPKGTTVEISLNQSDGDRVYDRNRFLEQRGLDANKEATMVAFWNQNRGNDALSPAAALRFYAENGIPPPTDDDLNKMIEQAKSGAQFGPVDTSADEAAYRADLEKSAARQGEAGLTERADQGLLYGYSDEIAGVGGAIGSLLRGDNPANGYQFSRDTQRLQNEKADQNTGLLGDAVEIGAGLVVPAGQFKTVQQGIRTGAQIGAFGGFGYGEGAEGSAINALTGASLGAAIGGGGAKIGNALAARAATRAESAPARNALLQAGADEGTTVNRAMVDPNLQSRVTGVSGTMAGSRAIEKEMGAISNQIEGRVANLGRNGVALTNETGGAKIRSFAQRQIEKSGQASKRIYDNAEKQAAGIKVAPKESVAVLDSAIADLTETPGLNSAEITFLKTLKDDFSKDLSVGALRRARTTLRKKISKGELTFGESEARVLSVMDAAANDIASGLTAQGKGNAARLFKKADGLYKERAKYIEGTLQKIIGKRNSNMSDQQVFAKFKALADAKGDGPAMANFMSELAPDEVADVAATFAADLGKNGKGDFSTAFLATQAEKLGKNPTALKAIFGEDGAKSINNLIILSKEHARVTNAARGSQTGIRADYRSWLTNAFFTGGAGLMAGVSQGAGSGAIAATATAATVGAAKLAKDTFSARALMSPKVTGWLRSAPRTTDPKAIDAHFKKLAAIAKAEPAIAGDIKSIQDFIIQAANDNSSRAAAGEQKPDRVRPES